MSRLPEVLLRQQRSYLCSCVVSLKTGQRTAMSSFTSHPGLRAPIYVFLLMLPKYLMVDAHNKIDKPLPLQFCGSNYSTNYSDVLKTFTGERIYGNLPPLSQKLAKRRLQFTGHCQRAMGEIVQYHLLWKPSCPVHSRRLTFPDVIARDSGINRSDLENAMADREVWSTVVACVPTSRD